MLFFQGSHIFKIQKIYKRHLIDYWRIEDLANLSLMFMEVRVEKVVKVGCFFKNFNGETINIPNGSGTSIQINWI